MPPLLLNEVEARILGSLIEKSLTTPESYPLSLNALANACNQKSSREPVMSIDETTVARGVASLQAKNLLSQRNEPGSRVTKFLHRAENLLGGGNSKEIGTICVLLLRGPQTPGEIKTRTDRLCAFESTAEVESLLLRLSQHPDGPFVVRLARQTGQKEARYAHLFSETASTTVSPAPPAKIITPPVVTKSPIEERLAALEKRVAQLEAGLPTGPSKQV